MKTAKLLFRNNLLVRKLLIIKDLILGKLDSIISSMELADQDTQENFQHIQQKTDLLLANSRSLLENQVFLLKSSVDIAHALQKSIHSTDQIPRLVGDSSRAFEQVYQGLDKLSQQVFDVKLANLEVIEDGKAVNTTNHQLLLRISEDVRNQKSKIVCDLSPSHALEAELMAFLYSYLPQRRAIDVGANRGDVTARLLRAGFEVYAFEPYPPVFEKLQERFLKQPGFHAFPCALGALNETRQFHLADDLTDEKTYDDSTFYNSLIPHSMSEGLVFKGSIPVTVKTLADLHQSDEMPCDVGLVKIDTEGFDLEVIKGMGEYRYPVVVAEFWDTRFPFGKSGAMNYLQDMVPAMRERNYPWHIIIYRIWGRNEVSYYCNSSYSFENSWGNVFFFQDYAVFQEALKWCTATMQPTYFAV